MTRNDMGHFRAGVEIVALGIVTATIGLLSLRASMPWIWADMALGAFQHSFAESPVLVSLSALTACMGIALVLYPFTNPLFVRHRQRRTDQSETEGNSDR